MAVRPSTITRWIGVVRREHPDLSVNQVEVLQAGIDHVIVEINRHYIFRLRKDGDRRMLAREVKVLKALEGKLEIPTPRLAFVGKELSYIGYPKIAGVALSAGTIAAMPRKARRAIATDLATFLVQLYETLSPDVAANLDIEKYALPDPDSVLDTIKTAFNAESWLAEFAEYARQELSVSDRNEFGGCALHWDLQGGNILVDPDTYCLTGIIDFDSVRIFDVHAEFRSIYRIDRELGASVLGEFSRLSGLRLSYRRAMAYGWLLKLFDLAKYARHPCSPTYKRAFACLQGWCAADGPAARKML